VLSGFRSMRRHLSVDLTSDKSFWTLQMVFLVGYSDSFYPSDGHSRWLKVRKIGTHLVSAAFLCPRFDRSVVGVE
jgi:hypothetical protein